MDKRTLAVVVPATLAGLILCAMLWQVRDTLVPALAHSNPLYLAPAVACCALAWWIRGIRYRVILAGTGVTISTTFSTALIMISQTANLIVPFRLGDLVRALILKKERDCPYSRGVSTLVVERIFDVVIIAILGLICLPFVLNFPGWFIPAICIPLILGGIFFAVLLFSGKVQSKNRVMKVLLAMAEDARAASFSLRALFVLSVTSAMVWVLDSLVCASVAMMLGVDVPFAVTVLAVVIGNLVKAVPITPGGLGTYELALAFTFSLAGAGESPAIQIGILDHLIKNLVTVAGGVAAIAYFGTWVISVIRSAFDRRVRGGDGPGGNASEEEARNG